MGMIINPYQFGVPFTGLLDTYSGASVAYSAARRLSSTYTGALIRVRRSSDNTEQDIGYDGSNVLDESALTTFVGAGDGFVTTWYDQSGNANNATQSTAAYQPKMVSSGVIEKDNGKAKLTFNGSSLFDCGDVLTVGSNNLISFIVAKDTSSSGTFYSRSYPDGRGARYALLNDSNGSLIINSTGSNVSVTTTLDNNKKLWNQEFIANTSHKFYKNNSLIGSFAGSVGEIGVGPSSLPFVIGAYGPTYIIKQTGFQQELIVYLSNQSSNLSSINSNINTFYSIY